MPTSPTQVTTQERGTLASLLISDQLLILTLDHAVMSFTEVASVLPSRAALADMVGTPVEITQDGQTCYLVRSERDPHQEIRITAAVARILHVIAHGVLSTITLGPAGLSLALGTHRVTFTGLGAFPPAGLDRLRGHAITIAATAAGRFEIAGSRVSETILATTITVTACPDIA